MKSSLLDTIKGDVRIIDFASAANLRRNERPQRKHYVVVVIEEMLRLFNARSLGLCAKDGFCYLFNGAYWLLLDKDELKSFLGEVALLMGVNSVDSKHHQFRDELLAQFFSSAQAISESKPFGTTLINLKNGTFEISPVKQSLRKFHKGDFLRYQLSFDFDPDARAPIFERFLDEVLPDKQAQNILAEYLGYVFIEQSSLKLETVLLLYGSGANGKSVFFEIVTALLGSENISNFSLEKLTSDNYSRAMLQGKLLNYASEISKRLDPAVFKQIASGEPVEARLPYGKPFTLTNYAKLLFNCNELPRDVEHTKAFHRRFSIVPFFNTIPEDRRDPLLAQKIIDNELAGVFNWVLVGLQRLLTNRRFTISKSVNEMNEQFRAESNPVKLYLDDSGFVKSGYEKENLKNLYGSFKLYCEDYGYKAVSYVNFVRRIENLDIQIKFINGTDYACIKQTNQTRTVKRKSSELTLQFPEPTLDEIKGFCDLDDNSPNSIQNEDQKENEINLSQQKKKQ